MIGYIMSDKIEFDEKYFDENSMKIFHFLKEQKVEIIPVSGHNYNSFMIRKDRAEYKINCYNDSWDYGNGIKMLINRYGYYETIFLVQKHGFDWDKIYEVFKNFLKNFI